MQVALVHEVSADVCADVGFEKDVVRQHDGGTALGLEATVDVLQECELLVGRGEGEILAGGQAAAFLGAKGRVSKDQAGFGQGLAFGAEGVAIADAAAEAVQHEVHERKAVRVLHVLHAEEGLVAVFALLGVFERVEVVVVAQVVVGGDQEAAGAGGGVLDGVGQLRLHQGNHAVDQHARGEILAGAGLLFVGVLLQQAFVEVTQVFAVHAVPVELVDFGDEGGERGGLLDEAAGVGKDFLHQAGTLAAEVDQEDLVVLEAVGRGASGEVGPAVVCGKLIFCAGFGGHLEEEQVGEFGNVLVEGDAVVLENVTKIPEFADDVGCGLVAHAGNCVFLLLDSAQAACQRLSLKDSRIWLSSPLKILSSRLKPPPSRRKTRSGSSSASRSTS